MRPVASLIVVVVASAAFPALAAADGPCASDADPSPAARCETRRPTVGIDVQPAWPHTGASVTLKASGIGRGLSFAWDLDGDGDFDDATGATVKRAFAAPTAIGVRTTDEDGRTATETRSLAVHASDVAPTAQLFTSPASPRAGADVHVIAQGTDADGAIATTEVDADGDGTYEASGSDTVVRFSTPGTKTLRARLTDDGGNVTTVTDTVDVHAGNLPPLATVDVQPPSPKTGGQVSLTTFASDADGSVDRYDYDLDGDGTFETPGDAFTTQTAYATAGTREIGVRVTDDAGATAVAWTSVAVRDADEPPFVALRRTWSTRTLFASGYDPDGGFGTYDWDLDGDGAFDDEGGFLLNYADIPGSATGTFDVGVRITDDEGDASVARRAVAIHDLPATVPSIAVSPAQPRVGETVTFDADTLADDLTNVSWDLEGDGTFSNLVSDTWLHQTTSYATPGPRTVLVKVTDRRSRTATARVEVDVSPAAGNLTPGAAFTASTDWPQTGAEVTLTDASTDADGAIASRAWDLDGDGAFDDGTGATASRGFPAAGDRTVALRVTDDKGASSIQRRTLQVHDGNLLPRAVIGGDGTLVLRAGEPATLKGAAAAGGDDTVTYAWDADDDGEFDDGTAAALPVSFPSPGFHRVRLRVTDAALAQDVATLLVDVRPAGAEHAPALSVSVPQATVRPGAAASFSAYSADAEDDPISVAWDLDGDGAFDDATGAHVEHAYAAAGTYVVRARASDGRGGQRTVTRTVDVVADAGLPPAFDSIVMPRVVRAGRPTTFSVWALDPDVSTGGVGPRGVTLAFDLDGDGDFDDVPDTVAGMPVGTYTWTFPGDAPVTIAVRAQDATGLTSVGTLQVRPTAANAGPAATLAVPAGIVAGQATRLFATATDLDGESLTYSWDADGDGTYGDGASAMLSRTFATPGTYSVGVQVTDGDGASTEVRRTFTVGGPPVKPSLSVSGHIVSQPTTLTSTTAGAVAQAWDLDDDGAFDDATGPEASVTFTTQGQHLVGLKARNADGDVGIRYEVVLITHADPGFEATPTPTPAPAAPPPPPVARDTVAPALTATAKAPRLAALLKRGLPVRARCSEACRVIVVATISRATAKRLALGGSVELAHSTKMLAAGASATVTLRLPPKVQKAIKRVRKLQVTLTTTATDAAGNRSVAKRTVTIRR